MKQNALHVFFGNDICNALKLNEVDYYLVSSEEVYNYIKIKLPQRCFFLDILDYSDSEKQVSYLRDFFKSLGDAYEPFFNAVFFSAFLPIFNVLKSIKNLIEYYKIDYVKLYGGADVSFLTMDYAEGESGKQFLYKREWMMNYYIYHSLLGCIPIEWSERESRFYITIMYKLRGFIIKYNFILTLILKCFNFSAGYKETKSLSKLQQQNIVICPIGLALQYWHLSDILSSKKNIVVYISNERINNNVFRTKNLSFSSIILILKKVYKEKVRMQDLEIADGKYFRFRLRNKDVRSLFKFSLLRFCSEYNRYLRSIDYVLLKLKPSKVVFVNNKTMGLDAYVDRAIASHFGCRLLTFQYVSMGKVCYPSYRMYDVMCFSSIELRKFHTNHIKETYAYQSVPIEPISPIDTSCKFSITLFLQPDIYNEVSISTSIILSKLAIKECNKLILNIKPHYRQNNIPQIKNAIRLLKGYDEAKINILDKGLSVKEVLGNTDMAVGFSSSVLTEAVYRGIPIVTFEPIDFIKKVVSNDNVLNSVSHRIFLDEDVLNIYDHRFAIHDSFVKLREKLFDAVNMISASDILDKYLFIKN